ncbi:50S ribosomal protein L7/L12 [Blattabacterium cuenoti]|uniref:50S ribosomal protein L7/L12 n=1 Tax=Blattabacterium cuenoti TaxID=1653831 RepID=UPI00163C8E8D|nr:50S ribosomal protein L7/L12 [Blattabacterium cuenoti]
MIKKLAEQLVNLTVKEINELAKLLKTDYGIEPTTITSSLNNASTINADKIGNNISTNQEEKNVFDLVLKSLGNSKLSLVKLVKEITGKGLKESKEIVDNIPQIIKKSVDKKEAEIIKKKFEDIGSNIELR